MQSWLVSRTNPTKIFVRAVFLGRPWGNKAANDRQSPIASPVPLPCTPSAREFGGERYEPSRAYSSRRAVRRARGRGSAGSAPSRKSAAASASPCAHSPRTGAGSSFLGTPGQLRFRSRAGVSGSSRAASSSSMSGTRAQLLRQGSERQRPPAIERRGRGGSFVLMTSKWRVGRRDIVEGLSV
jgi:hypothetical protein